MEKRIKTLLVLVIAGLLLGAPIVALASDISQATEYGNIRISNNGTAASNVATVMTLSSSNLISQGWVDSSFTRMAIRNASGADVPFMPSINAIIPWSLWVPSIGATSQLNYILYSGPANMGATKYYFPGASGMSVADHASLEPSDNFSQTYQGYFDTTAGSNKYIARKPETYEIFVSPSVSGTITAQALNQIPTIFPLIASNTTGSGDAGSVPVTLPSGIVEDDLILVIINTYNGAGAPTFTVPTGYTVVFNTTYNTANSRLAAWYKVATGSDTNPTWTLSSSSWYQYQAFRIAKDTYQGVPVAGTLATGATGNADPPNLTSGFGNRKTMWMSVAGVMSTITAAPTGYSGSLINSYSTQYLATAEKYAQATSENPGTFTNTSNAWGANTIALKGWGSIAVSATGVSSGEHTIVVTSNATSFGIQIDGGAWITTDPAATLDYSTNWTIGQNNVMPYIQSINMSVGGNLKGSWQWQYAETFTDQSGNGNTATPSFRTASSNANVSATLSSFQPIAVARAPAYAVTDAPSFITGPITASSNFTTANVTGSRFPGSDVVDASAAAAGVPNIWLWGILGGITIALGGLGVSYMERRFGTGNGTLLLRILVGVLIFGLMITFGKFDFWMLVIYLFIVIAPAIASRQYEIGASPGELNLIGFLAMTWIGLTAINRIIQGQLLTSAETSHLNTLMFTQQFTLLDMFSMPILNFQFFSEGIPALLRWDYAMFGGNAQIIQYLLYSLTAVMTMIILGFLVGTLTSYFSKAR